MSGSVYPSFAVMAVDDEEIILTTIRTVLKAEGITNLVCVADSRRMLELLDQRDTGIILLDLTMPGLSGEELIPLIRLDHPEVSVVVITGNREVENAVACMKAGVSDYLVKPVERTKLAATVRRFIEIQELRRENSALQRRFFATALEQPEVFVDLITADPAMRSLMQYAEAIGRTGHVALVTGETGTGKDLLARAIHGVSGRSGGFIAVNTAGLDDPMFADALFGHRAGAFTGAAGELKGFIEQAAGGTLFLDEIGDLSQSSQVKLLRLLETGEYVPLGSDVARKADVRIVVATNKDLRAEMAAGRFRKDLFYRLSMHHLHIPPLRERKDDLPLLVRHFLDEAAGETDQKAPTPPDELFPLLRSYDFPGNVRELRSMVFDAVSRHEKGMLSLKVFRTAVGAGEAALTPDDSPATPQQRLLTIRQTVDLLIAEAMKKAQGNRAVAARILGITPQALGQRLKRSGPK